MERERQQHNSLVRGTLACSRRELAPQSAQHPGEGRGRERRPEAGQPGVGRLPAAARGRKCVS